MITQKRNTSPWLPFKKKGADMENKQQKTIWVYNEQHEEGILIAEVSPLTGMVVIQYSDLEKSRYFGFTINEAIKRYMSRNGLKKVRT